MPKVVHLTSDDHRGNELRPGNSTKAPIRIFAHLRDTYLPLLLKMEGLLIIFRIDYVRLNEFIPTNLLEQIERDGIMIYSSQECAVAASIGFREPSTCDAG